MKAKTVMEKRERPTIFSTDSVRAILENRKTQSRRVVKVESPYLIRRGESWFESYNENHFIWGAKNKEVKCPFGKIGDLLWVRRKQDGSFAWKKSDAFLYLEITNIKVERLQDISWDDLELEGIKCPNNCRGDSDCECTQNEKPQKFEFTRLWNLINSKREGCSWNSNPFVWCLEFKKLET